MNTANEINNGTGFATHGEFLAHEAKKQAILNPPPPKPRVEAIKIVRGGRLYNGKLREEGEVLLVMPNEMPEGFISKLDAQDLVDGLNAMPLTADEIEAFLENQAEQQQ